MLKWTFEDDRLAALEGWNLFDCIGGPHDGTVRIQKIDDPELYRTACPVELKSDIQAIRLVARKAREGSDLHRKAWKLHKGYTA